MKASYSGYADVEDMYRWINLRHVAGGTETRATDITEQSNNPDVLSNGKNFVFVHGYSVSEEQARGWNAETFKRLYWTGSRAKFYAVTWFGNDIQNYNANDHKPNGWGRNGEPYNDRWLHSDLKNMAYLYTYELFNQLVSQGGLQ